jgi:hypothetical protein
VSSKRRLRRRQCRNKRRFVNLEEAQRTIAYLSQMERNRPGLHAYACQFCRGWHIGRAMKQFKGRTGVKAWEWNQGV